jgi:hypothetical protein
MFPGWPAAESTVAVSVIGHPRYSRRSGTFAIPLPFTNYDKREVRMRDNGESLRTPGRSSALAALPHPARALTRGAGAAQPRSWLGRILHRRKTTTYQRCLAVHIHFAGPRSALS